jgi:hypothetical protein
MEEPAEYAPEIVKCCNCQYFLDGECLQTKERQKVKPEQDCDSGMFDILDTKKIFQNVYNDISEIIRFYMDIPESTINIVTLWIIGTYFYENFFAYPFLFINAMRGSGKTRLLKLISTLSENGRLLNSLTDAVMFRTKGTLCIDEFEGLGSKEKTSLRELLNSAYKKGTKVLRMKKKKCLTGEEQVIEEFEPYRPISMANIWGMEEVLGDRCIYINLEKSDNSKKVNLIENFNNLDYLIFIKTGLKRLIQCRLCSVGSPENIYRDWNLHVSGGEACTIHTLHTYTTLYTQPTLPTYIHTKNNERLFNKISEIKINGRNLELFFPIFLIAEEISEEILEKTIEYAKLKVEEKKVEEITESLDVMLYSLVAKQEASKFYFIKELLNTFNFVNTDSIPNGSLSNEWMGKALKRLNLIINKKRVGNGIQVTLNVNKAIEKEKMFKPKDATP